MTRILRLFAAIAVALVLADARPAAAAGRPPVLDYRTAGWFLPASPGVFGGPAAGLFNPAAFALTDEAGADFWWNDRSVRRGLDNYGLAFGRTLNFAMNATTFGSGDDHWQVYDYQLGFAHGTRRYASGLAYRWSRGETDRLGRESALVAGMVGRPDPRVSLGLGVAWSLKAGCAQYVLDLGLRPTGRDWLTAFADWTVLTGEKFVDQGHWSAGLELRPLRGLHLGARAREPLGGGKAGWSAYAAVTVDEFGFGVLPAWDGDGGRAGTAYMARTTVPFRGFDPGRGLVLKRPPVYHSLDLQNRTITYQKYRWLDDERVAWLDLLRLLDAVRDDDTIAGLALNLAGTRGRPSLLHDLRVKLQELRAAGKEVIVHGDRFTPLHAYVASAADRVTIDPWGMVGMPGFALARSYLKGTLEKLGLGFQEFRYFTYKSAAETFARDSMSGADREQRQRIVDVLYAAVNGGIAEGRGLDPAAVDRLVDDKALLLPEEALAAGLVDAVARWDELGEWLREHRGARLSSRPPRHLGREWWDEQWGEPAIVPVVYAVGACAMDSGLKGRKTSAYLRGLVRDPRVKAVVLRADSPGGDPLPSDLVADAVRQLKEAGKPVVVSQGDVAASGGYWISMDGTRVLTTPLTVTGSIGVIGGWIWDDGFSGRLGVTSDAVSRGAHADLFTTVNLPFLGGIPRRAMTDDELARTKEAILDNYDKFVAAVARGRGLDEAAVRAVAEGRVWMGGDAVARGLCDGFGTLDEAIRTARELAGLPAWRDVRVVEYPPRPLVELPSLLPQLPSLFGLGDRLNRALAGAFVPAPTLNGAGLPGAPGLTDLDVAYLRLLATVPGRPLVMVPADVLPEAWGLVD